MRGGLAVFAFFQCIGEAVAAKGFGSLARELPFGDYLCDVASDAWRRLKERKRDAEMRAEVQAMAAAAASDVKAAAAAAARLAFPAGSEKAIELELYLTQIPAAVRQSLRRADDPTGTTVPAAFSLARAEDLLPLLPTRVSRFRPGDGLPGRPGWTLTDLLGTGGFGEVWLARHPSFASLQRAVKFCLDLTDRDRTLLHEGGLVDRVMGARDTPHIVKLIDAELTGDAPWLMYEYVPGGDLVARAAGWRVLPAADRHARARDALQQIATAVAHFHKLGVVHRDLKPANVLVEPDADDRSPATLKVADFGIGGVLSAHELSAVTRAPSTGARLATAARGAFTPLYASPQQKKGLPPDPRDDVFALGVIGYQLLVGDVTAERPGGKGWKRDLQTQGVSSGLLDLLEACWDDDPLERPADAGALLTRLRTTPPPVPEGPRGDETRLDAEPRRPERSEPKDWMKRDRSEWPVWVRIGLGGLRDRQAAIMTVCVCTLIALVALLAACAAGVSNAGLVFLGGSAFALTAGWCFAALRWGDRNLAHPDRGHPEPWAGVAGGGLLFVALVAGAALLGLRSVSGSRSHNPTGAAGAGEARPAQPPTDFLKARDEILAIEERKVKERADANSLADLKAKAAETIAIEDGKEKAKLLGDTKANEDRLKVSEADRP